MKRILVLILFTVIAGTLACKKNSAVDAVINDYLGTLEVNGSIVKEKGMAVKFGDRLETGDKSFCTIIVGDKNIFRLGANSALVFNVSRENNSLDLERGWFSGVTRKIFTKQANYLVKSPTITASIRGTSYCVKVEDSKNTYFCVCNGTISLADPLSGNQDEVSSSHHTARRYSSDENGKITVDTNPGMLYHDDAGVEALAAAINEKIDWSSPDKH